MMVASLKCGTRFWTDSISKDDWIGTKSFVDWSFAHAKKGASPLGKPSLER
jgi:hypothetical protein